MAILGAERSSAAQHKAPVFGEQGTGVLRQGKVCQGFLLLRTGRKIRPGFSTTSAEPRKPSDSS